MPSSTRALQQLDVSGNKQPGFQVPYVFSSALKTVSTGDISKNPYCAFAVDHPVVLKKLWKKLAKTPAAAAASSSIAPVALDECNTVSGLACAGAIACAIFTFGLCTGVRVRAMQRSLLTKSVGGGYAFSGVYLQGHNDSLSTFVAEVCISHWRGGGGGVC